MDLLQSRPKLADLNEWCSKFQENKWAFVAYTGQSTRTNTSRWYAIEPTMWSMMRYYLEAFNASNMELAFAGHFNTHYDARPPSTSVLRGYEAFGLHSRPLTTPEVVPQALLNLLDSSTLKRLPLPTKELQGTDYVMPNTFTFLVFDSMPLGSRPYVPITERSDYALMQHQLAILESSNSKKGLKRLLAEKAALETAYAQKWHACDRKRKYVDLEAHGVRSTVVYSEPPLDYLCVECNRHGHHYREACFLWPKDAPKFVMGQFGCKKFGAKRDIETTDPLLYSLIHKKHTQ